MPRTGRATVMVGKEFEIREYPVADPEPGTLILRQELGGICGTDLHNWEHQRINHDIILGHENVGIIDTLGEGVDTDYLGNPVKVGDRVALSPSGGYGFQPSEEAPYLRGGFAEYIYVSNPQSKMFLKTSLPPEIAVLSEPAACAAHCVSRGRIEFGDTVVIQGSGPIGLLALNWARVSGAGRLIVVGGPAGRLEMAERLGADLTINIHEVTDPEERKKIVRENTPQNKGADVVYECSGFLAAIPEGLDYIRYGGTYVEYGHFVDVGTFECNPNQMLMRKNLRLEAGWGFEAKHFLRAVPMLEKHASYLEGFVSHILPLEDVARGFDALHTNYHLDGKDTIKIAVKGGSA
jgi:L-iditol 2-dehydrogenase